MKNKVTDTSVAEYAARLRSGGPLGKVFPAPMSDCDFTESQRQTIREARAYRKAASRNGKGVGPSANELNKPIKVPPPANSIPAADPKPKALSKLGKMLYLQSGCCFFCGKPLTENEASIEHLNPKSHGGTSSADNEVVCHRSLNETFGSMDLKSKFAFVLKAAGSFKCPKQ